MTSLPLALLLLTGIVPFPVAPARLSAEAAPDPGVVIGRVTDSETGTSLPGATVRIEGTSLGTASDLNGNFRIPGAPEGEQALVISYVGYRTVRVAVAIPSGGTVRQDVALTLDVLEGQEVLITAQAGGQVAAINQQLASNTIVNVVSAARIQELPDVNAAESVGRLPGISIVRNAGEGQKVVVRGLSPKYSNVTVNGQRLPSTEFGDRSMDLSMISSDMLAGIEVIKAATPDRDADVIGGTVNFQLMEARDGFRSDVRLQAGYNDQVGSMGTYKGTVNVSDRLLQRRLGVVVQANLERADRSSDVFNANYQRLPQQVAEGQRIPIHIQGLTLQDRSEIRKRSGVSLILDYRLPGGRVQMNNFVSRMDRAETLWSKGYSLGGRSVQYGIRDREMMVDVLANTLAGEMNAGRTELTWNLHHSLSRQKRPYDNSFTFSELAAFNEGLVLDEGPAVIPQSARNRLDETYLEWGDFEAARMSERDLGAEVNLKRSFALGRFVSGYAKGGGKYRGKSRSNDDDKWYLAYYYGDGANYVRDAFAGVSFTPTSQGHLALTNFLDRSRNTSDFLNGQYELNAVIDRKFMNDLHDYVGHRYFRTHFADLGDFEVDENITAGYAMAEVDLGRRIMLMGGVRYEHTYTHYEARRGATDHGRSEIGYVMDTTSTQRFDYLLPMLHVRVRFTNWLDVRLARTETLSRPDFPLFSPRERFQDTARRIDRGNPELRPAQATNYDAILSVYANRIGLFTLGGFYKEIDEIIYLKERTVLVPEEHNLPAYTRGYRLTEPVNNEFLTTIKGVEVEWQTYFTYLPGLLSGVVLSANYTRIFSDTKYPRTILVRDTRPPFRSVAVDTFRVGRMINQPAHVANLTIGFDRRGFSGRVSMLYQQSSLTRVGEFREEDGFSDTYVRWDAMLQQKVGRFFSIFLNLNNFTDRPDMSSLGIGHPTTQEYYGWTADVGVRYRY